jgi:hypothetical protein
VDTLEIVIIAVVAVLALLVVGGAIANRRRRDATAGQWHARVDQANQDLAAAHASDRGWEPARVEAAARQAFEERRPGEAIADLALVQVVDPPGTDDDKAVFRVQAGPDAHHLTLGRRGDEWVLEDLR